MKLIPYCIELQSISFNFDLIVINKRKQMCNYSTQKCLTGEANPAVVLDKYLDKKKQMYEIDREE